MNQRLRTLAGLKEFESRSYHCTAQISKQVVIRFLDGAKVCWAIALCKTCSTPSLGPLLSLVKAKRESGKSQNCSESQSDGATLHDNYYPVGESVFTTFSLQLPKNYHLQHRAFHWVSQVWTLPSQQPTDSQDRNYGIADFSHGCWENVFFRSRYSPSFFIRTAAFIVLPLLESSCCIESNMRMYAGTVCVSKHQLPNLETYYTTTSTSFSSLYNGFAQHGTRRERKYVYSSLWMYVYYMLFVYKVREKESSESEVKRACNTSSSAAAAVHVHAKSSRFLLLLLLLFLQSCWLD